MPLYLVFSAWNMNRRPRRPRGSCFFARLAASPSPVVMVLLWLAFAAASEWVLDVCFYAGDSYPRLNKRSLFVQRLLYTGILYSTNSFENKSKTRKTCMRSVFELQKIKIICAQLRRHLSADSYPHAASYRVIFPGEVNRPGWRCLGRRKRGWNPHGAILPLTLIGMLFCYFVILWFCCFAAVAHCVTPNYIVNGSSTSKLSTLGPLCYYSLLL